jgi:TFIIF-interacting CTD phosphatase-like protein
VPTPTWSWVKDLSRLGRDLSQTLIVDDCAAAALLQPANWLSIRPFSQADVKWDTALLEVLHFLLYKVRAL